MLFFAFIVGFSMHAVCARDQTQDGDSVSLLQVRAHQFDDVGQTIPATTMTTTTVVSLDGLDDTEKEIEIADEQENVHECQNWCYSKKHKGKAWEGQKCNWYACSLCPECPATTDAPTNAPTTAPTEQRLVSGTYTIQQKQTMRYMDAYASSHDNSVVTRTAQIDGSQKWLITPASPYTLVAGCDSKNGIDCHDGKFCTSLPNGPYPSTWDECARLCSSQDSCVAFSYRHTGTTACRTCTTSQVADRYRDWGIYIKGAPVGDDEYTIQQKQNSRFLDAYMNGNDYSAVTRTAQTDASQNWLLTPLGNGEYTIQQKQNLRYMDAHINSNDHSVVTRTAQNDDSQRWIVTPVVEVPYTLVAGCDSQNGIDCYYGKFCTSLPNGPYPSTWDECAWLCSSQDSCVAFSYRHTGTTACRTCTTSQVADTYRDWGIYLKPA